MMIRACLPRRFLSRGTRHQQEEVSLGIKMNLNLAWMAENIDDVATNIKLRNSDADAYKVKQLYEEVVGKKKECERIRSERKRIAKEMSNKSLEPDRRPGLIAAAKGLKQDLAKEEASLEDLQEILNTHATRIPNLTSPETPPIEEKLIGLINAVTERDVTEDIGDGTSEDHMRIGRKLGILDFDSTSKVAGQSHACFLKGDAALLELALVNFALSYVQKKGFVPVITPDIARRTIIERCGFNPKNQENLDSQVYQLEDSDLCLIGTSEIPLAGMMSSELLDEKTLPQKYVAYSHCFRREAQGSGTEGGLYRMHQFTKVEMFAFSSSRQSDSIFHEILEIQREIFELLELECRVVEMPAIDLGAPAYRKVDIEAWMPGRRKYGEISSASNCLDYQSRRLDIRYRPSEMGSNASLPDDDKSRSGSGKTAYVHTLNGTACAVPRTMIAIMEQHQTPDGGVTVPQVLRPFLQKDVITLV
ncbi:hypothetical protein AAMO2058_001042800 [Amorphochlora amoebiformis]